MLSVFLPFLSFLECINIKFPAGGDFFVFFSASTCNVCVHIIVNIRKEPFEDDSMEGLNAHIAILRSTVAHRHHSARQALFDNRSVF